MNTVKNTLVILILILLNVAVYPKNKLGYLPKSIVRIYGSHNLDSPAEVGTGFIFQIKNDVVYILTARHNIRDESDDPYTNKRVKFLERYDYYQADLVFSEKKTDFAILAVQSFPKDLKPLYLGESKDINIGDEVFFCSYSQTGQTKFGTANISSKDWEKMYLDKISLVGGNSGSPLLYDQNNVGIVVGLIIQKSTNSQKKKDYVLNIDLIRQYIEHKKLLTPLPDISRIRNPYRWRLSIGGGNVSHEYLDINSSFNFSFSFIIWKNFGIHTLLLYTSDSNFFSYSIDLRHYWFRKFILGVELEPYLSIGITDSRGEIDPEDERFYDEFSYETGKQTEVSISIGLNFLITQHIFINSEVRTAQFNTFWGSIGYRF